MDAAMQVVFDGACLRAQCHGAGTAGVIVTFDHWRKDRAGFPVMGPVQRVLDMGYRSLVVSTAANDWYLNGETMALQAALAAFVPRGAVVRAFGFSMGGYGALLFSRALQLQSVVLFGAQASIRRDVVPFETRWQREAVLLDGTLDCLADVVKPDLRGVVLFDPRKLREETLQARAVQAVAPLLQLAALPFSGHPPTAVIMAGKAYGGLMARGIAGVVTAADMRALHRAHREAAPDYLDGVLAFLRRRGTAGADLI
jgi:hypothetical protein